MRSAGLARLCPTALCSLALLAALAVAPARAASSDAATARSPSAVPAPEQKPQRRASKSVASIGAPLRQEFEAFMRQREAPADADTETLFREFLDEHPEAVRRPTPAQGRSR